VLVGGGPLFDALARGVVVAGHTLAGVVTTSCGQVPAQSPCLARGGVNREKVLSRICELRPDVLLVGSWPEKLGPALLQLPRLGCVNCHPSLLPAHRGPNPYVSAIVSGEIRTGVTFHRMTQRWDAGLILLQREVPIDPEDTGGSLRTRCARVAEKMVAELTEGLAAGSLQPQVQEEGRATRFPLPRDRDLEIDWRQPAVRIRDWIRAVQPWQRCYSHLGQQRVSFAESVVVPSVAEGTRPGEVLESKGRNLRVATGDPKAALQLSIPRSMGTWRRLPRVGCRFSLP
jgi:methionyl-tRNA formyltransferase